MKSKIIAFTLVGIGFLLGASALSAFADWTAAPPSGPPGCPTGYPGCDAPVHVGGTAQVKDGPLTLNWLSTAVDGIGLKILGSIKMSDGNVVSGVKKVLTDVNGTGVGTWEVPDGGVGSASSGITFLSPATITSYVKPVGANNIAPDPVWASYPLGVSVPVNAKGVILQSDYSVSGGSRLLMEISKDGGTSAYILSKGGAPAGWQNYSGSEQSIFPISSSNTIYYRVTRDDNDVSYNIKLIGYIM